MEGVMTYAQSFFGWLLQATLIASVVICLILLIQKMLGGKLGPRWCHALWLVLLIRMILPWAPSSRVSLLNLIPSWKGQTQSQQLPDTIEQQDVLVPRQTDETSEAITSKKPESESAIQQQVVSKPSAIANVEGESTPRWASIRQVLPVLWLAGAIVIGAYLLLSNFALWRIVKRDSPLVNQTMLELFEECKAQMGVQSLVAVVPSSQIRSPALFGFIRPRLLLPLEILEKASREEMRYVFLHELAHLKRRDIYLGWLTSLLQVLHWFNPLVWFAFYRMRADREFACDALVLACTQKEESQEYGQAIVSLVRRFSHSRRLPAMAGIIENKSQLKRRIAMIAQFKKNSYRWSPLPVLLIVAIGCTSLSNMKRSTPGDAKVIRSEPSMTLRKVLPEVGDFANVSPDGNYLCDVDWDTGNLVVRELYAGRRWPVTGKKSWEDSKEYALDAAISPDSQRVAYLWHDDVSDSSNLYVVGFDGTGRRLLCRDKYLVPRDWSADGTKILGVLFEEPKQMVWVDTQDGSIEKIRDMGDAYPKKLDISPDGRFLAYDHPQAENTSKRDVFLLDLRENRQIRLAEHPADDRLLGWTPDGRRILFASNRSDKWDAWLLGISDGIPAGTPLLAKVNIGDVGAVGFASNGDYYFSIYDLRENVYVARLDLAKGTLVSPPKPLRPTDKSDRPVFSPDGQNLAYACRSDDDTSLIKIRSLASGQEQEIAFKVPPCLHFWAPDSKSLLLSGFLDKSWYNAVYTLDLETEECSELLRHKDMSIPAAQWFPDGKRILYHGRHDPIGGTEKLGYLMIWDIDSGEEREITHGAFPGLGDRFWALSPDGRQLAVKFNGDNSRIKIFSTETDEVREVLAGELAAKVHRIIWAPDGKTLMLRVLDRSVSNKSEIWRIAADGGKPEKLSELDIPEYVTEMRIDPTGRHIALQAITNVHELWLMENFLPEDLGK